MRKIIKPAVLLCAATVLVFSCAKDYDEEFAKIEQRIADLKEADKETRRMILQEMDRLSLEINTLLGEMESRVLANLETKVSEVEKLILQEMDKVREHIVQRSFKTGKDISVWEANLNNLIGIRASDFTRAQEKMEKELSAAIKSGDAALEQRIRIGLGRLNSIQTKLPQVVEATCARMKAVEGLEEEYRQVNEKMERLDAFRSKLQGRIDSYEEAILDMLEKDLDSYASKDLQTYYEAVADLYSDSRNIMDEIESNYAYIDDNMTSLPDIESLLDEAQDLVDTMYDMESMLDDFSTDDVQDLLSELEYLLEETVSCEYDCGELYDNITDLEAWMDEAMTDLDYLFDVASGLQDKLEEEIDYLIGLNSYFD